MSTGAFILSGNSMTVSYGGKVYTIRRDQVEFDEAKTAIAEERWSDIPAIMDKVTRVQQYSPKGEFRVVDGRVQIDGEDIPDVLSRRILEFIEMKAPYKPLIRFWKRLKNNPSFRAVNELYGFLEATSIPILDDGRILAYKVVHPNSNPMPRELGYNTYGKVTVEGKAAKQFVDIHSGKVQQGIGDVVSMPRNAVNEDSNQTCSHGLKCVASL